MSDAIPQTPDEVDAAWLTERLRSRFPGVDVETVRIADRREVTNSHSTLELTYRPGAGLPPATMFCKLPPESARRAAILTTGMGRREALFYTRLAPALALRTPAVYIAEMDEGDGSFVLVMEDLVASGCRVSDGTWCLEPDAAAAALEDLAGMHTRYADPTIRRVEAGWVQPSKRGSRNVVDTLGFGLAHHRDRLSPTFARLAEIYLEQPDRIHALWQEGPHTVIHGDTHIGNLFVDHGRAGFLDWGMIGVTTPMREVSYFINMALSTEDRRAHERDLIREYIGMWNAAGGPPISWDEAWTAHRRHAAYCVPACCQIVTFPEDATDRRKVFAGAFLARAEAARADLDALRAVEDGMRISSAP